ncbi:sirohydrochlorin chelatase [Pseudogracilibacillus sp. SO30301A]|uniref:sirohydrochlorin chelatase n=1 Tax=Pseudogracilibacillus sp. SO30301A TaxID=3098291 RepID=UPI00300E36C8
MFIIQAVLYVAHGSRLKEGVQEAKEFISKQIDRISAPIQLISFIELQPPLVEAGIEQCVLQGATHIVVVSILLLEAGHAKHDLPMEIERAKRKYPHVTFSYGRPFGVQESIIDTLVDRIEEEHDITEDARVLIVGRGSTDTSIRSDFKNIKELLNERINVSSINVCYIAAQNPTLEEGLQKEVKSGAKCIFIVPYLLFTGLLMLHLEKKVQETQAPEQTLILCQNIGWNEKISKFFVEHVNKKLR